MNYPALQKIVQIPASFPKMIRRANYICAARSTRGEPSENMQMCAHAILLLPARNNGNSPAKTFRECCTAGEFIERYFQGN